jgi:hypothetical protein
MPNQPTRAGRSSADVRALAKLLDEAIRLPGTNIRVGLDAVLGLIPGAGDVAGALLSAVVLVRAAGLGAPSPVLARMVGNVAIDALVGAVPLLGDLFDIGWKANTRNVRLLERYLETPAAATRSSRAVVAGLLLLLVLAVAGGVALAILVVRALISAAS